MADEPTIALDEAGFRADIRALMNWGQPVDPDKRATFHFADGRVFGTSDLSGKPYDWTTAATGGSPAAPDVTVLVGFFPEAPQDPEETPAGPVGDDLSAVYLFEDEWAQVSDFTSMTFDGNDYDRMKRSNVLTMGGISVYVVTLRARDLKGISS